MLEAGCGEGFGAEILAERADHVVGIDLKPALLIHARSRYPSSNLDFQVMDCGRLGFQSASFDAVVCNELLEHLPDPDVYIDEALRVLTANGLFICATTNAELTFHKADGSPLNRNHFQEYSPGSFRKLYHSRFPQVGFFGLHFGSHTRKFMNNLPSRALEWLLMRLRLKHKIPYKYRSVIRQRLTGIQLNEVLEEGFSMRQDAMRGAMYLVGIGVKGSRESESPQNI